MNGQSVPFVTDSNPGPEGTYLQRVYGRSLRLTSAREAEYIQGIEAVLRLPDGTIHPTIGASLCTSHTVAYRWEGERLVLARRYQPGGATFDFDTLRWTGRALVQRDFVGGDLPDGSEFAYRARVWPDRICDGIFSPFDSRSPELPSAMAP